MQPLVPVQPADLVAALHSRGLYCALAEDVLTSLGSIRLIRVDGRACVNSEGVFLFLFNHSEGASTWDCDLIHSGRRREPHNTTHYRFGSEIFIGSFLWHNII